MSAYDVAVIIVTYNSEDEIAACLDAVYSECRDVSMQVIVVDNASSDKTVEIVSNRFPGVKLILPGGNLGFSKGVNYGARDADADFVLLLNPDTVVRRHAIDVIVRFARANPQYGLYGGRTFRTDGSLEPLSCLGLPTLFSTLMFATGLSSLASGSRFLNPESLGGWKRDTVREVGVITGCFLLVPTAIWKNLGGLDESYFMYGEDVDFAIRARALGCRPVICPEAELVHMLGKSSDSPAHKMLLLYRGKASLMRRHWFGWRLKAGLFLLAAGTGLRALPSVWSRPFHPDGNRWRTVWRHRGEWLCGYARISVDQTLTHS